MLAQHRRSSVVRGDCSAQYLVLEMEVVLCHVLCSPHRAVQCLGCIRLSWGSCCASECTHNREPPQCATLARTSCATCSRLCLTCVMHGMAQLPSGRTAFLASKSWPGWRCRPLHLHPGQLFDAREAVCPLGGWVVPRMTQVSDSLKHIAQVIHAKVTHSGALYYACTHLHNTVPNRIQLKFCRAQHGDHNTWHSTTSHIEHTERCSFLSPQETGVAHASELSTGITQHLQEHQAISKTSKLQNISKARRSTTPLLPLHRRCHPVVCHHNHHSCHRCHLIRILRYHQDQLFNAADAITAPSPAQPFTPRSRFTKTHLKKQNDITKPQYRSVRCVFVESLPCPFKLEVLVFVGCMQMPLQKPNQYVISSLNPFHSHINSKYLWSLGRMQMP